MWIIPTNLLKESSPTAQVMEALNLDSKEQAWLCSQSLMWRSKHSPSGTWLKRLKRDSCTQHLCGRILKPSHWSDFEEEWTDSLGVIPVNHSQQQESERESLTPDTSGPGLLRQLDLFDQAGASLRMSKDTLPKGCVTSCQTWESWVTDRRGEYSQRVKSVSHTNARGSSSWPTASARDWKGCYKTLVRKDGKMRGDLLPDAVNLHQQDQGNWPTPAARDVAGVSGAGRQERKGHPLDTLPNAVLLPLRQDQDNPSTGGNPQGSLPGKNWRTPTAAEEKNQDFSQQVYLQNQVQQAQKEQNWPTARTADAEGGPIETEQTEQGFRSKRAKSDQWFGAKLRDAVETHEKGKNWATPVVTDSKDVPYQGKPGKRQLRLLGEVQKEQNWGTPRVSMAQDKMEDPAKHRLGEQAQNQTNGKLNPRWVEMLMGLPLGWCLPTCGRPIEPWELVQ